MRPTEELIGNNTIMAAELNYYLIKKNKTVKTVKLRNIIAI